MYIRFEKIPRKGEIVSVIDETNKYLGKMLMVDFVDCIDKDKDTFEEDNYLYFFADKKELEKRLCQ